MMTRHVSPAVTSAPRTILDRIDALPEGTWWSCRRCRATLHHTRARQYQGVCPECGQHSRLSARERIAQLADPGSFAEFDANLAGGDQLGFTDRMPYPQRLAQARQATSL